MAGLAKLADQVADAGRYGDTEIVHMNPEEIAALEAILGDMTRNPQTGELEAFSWKKLLAGIGLGAATVFSAGATAPAWMAALAPMFATAAGGLVSSSLTEDGKKKTDSKQSEAGAYLKAKNDEEVKKMGYYPLMQYYNPAAQANAQGIGQNWFTTGSKPVEPMAGGVSSLMGGSKGYAEGGPVEPEEIAAHMVMAEAMAAIEGKSPNPEKAINDFIAMFGKEALEELAGGGAEGEESAVRGPGGGMDDMVTADLQGQKVLLSPNEHIIPADAVSHLGDGSSDAGHRELDAMIQRIRMAKTGSPKQPGKIDPTKVMVS